VDQVRTEIVEYMSDKAYRPLLAAELRAAVAPQLTEADFVALLAGLEAEGVVVQTRRRRYGLPGQMNLVVGELTAHHRGFAFVTRVRGASWPELFISPGDINGAMHGDLVIARPLGPAGGRADGDRRREGEVIRILRRANQRVVGLFEGGPRYGFVTPDDPRLQRDIFVPREEFNGAVSGEKVVVSITRWPEKGRGAEGSVSLRLGPVDRPGIDVLSIMIKHDLDREFSPEVLAEASASAADRSGFSDPTRQDVRALPTLTIDPPDARDLDDAVSLERGQPDDSHAWRLYVHIADVAHYVRAGGPLDEEARERGTSVYLVDRAVPMLPEELSAGACSLLPGEERLAMSVMADLSAEGSLLDYRIFPSVIRSDRRLNYDQALTLMERGGSTPPGDHVDGRIALMLSDMSELARILRREREERGAIDFEFPEVEVVLDESGRASDIRPYHRHLSHYAIEEFMILANQVVASELHWRNVPALYRVHEPPRREKMEALRDFSRQFGHNMKLPEKVHPRLIQNLLRQVRGRREEYLINMVTLRSLERARYASSCLGHFALALREYTHFTSPIRRYPDLVVHRILHELAGGGRLSDDSRRRWEEILPQIAERCSRREREAEEAERETVDVKKVQFMEERVGEVFEGIVSGVMPFGFFVQLPNTVEGLVHVSQLDDDYYQLEAEEHALVGRHTGKRYRLGDPLKVEVVGVDPRRRQVDFIPVKRCSRGDSSGRKGRGAPGIH